MPAEKFQPRIVASFRPHQLDQVAKWVHDHVVFFPGLSDLESFRRALEAAEQDEKGAPLDEKGKRRLFLGVKAWLVYDRDVVRGGKTLVGEIKAWQQSPNEEDIRLDMRVLSEELRYRAHPRYRLP